MIKTTMLACISFELYSLCHFSFVNWSACFIISRRKFSMYRQDIGVDGSSIDSCFNIKERLKRIGRKGPGLCGYFIYSLCKDKLKIFRIVLDLKLLLWQLLHGVWLATYATALHSAIWLISTKWWLWLCKMQMCQSRPICKKKYA